MPIRKYVYQDETSNKFWNISWEDMHDSEYTVHYGRVGTAGVEKVIEVEDYLGKEVIKLIKSKVKKGYVKVEQEINVAYNLSVEDLKKGLNPIYKLIAIIAPDSDTYSFEYTKGVSTYYYNHGDGNEYEMTVKGDQAILRDFDHENIFSQEGSDEPLFDFEYLVYNGAPDELIKLVDPEYLTYGMWTTKDGVWYDNTMFESDFAEDCFEEDGYNCFMFEILNREGVVDKLEDYFDLEVNDEILDIVFKDEAITKNEIIRILDLVEESGIDADVIQREDAAAVAKKLANMYK